MDYQEAWLRPASPGLASRSRKPAEGGRPEERVLAQPLRRRIFGYVRAHPGESYTEIRLDLSLSKGALTHHLLVLLEEGFVLSRSECGRKVFYSAEAFALAKGNDRPAIQERLLLALFRVPGAKICEVARTIGVSRQLATHHARLLAQEGVVRLERRANRLCAVPIGRLEVPG